MKFLIVGEHFSTNLGDGVICEVVKYFVKEEYPDSKIAISDLSGLKNYEDNNENGNRYHPIQYKLKKILDWIIFKAINRNSYLKYLYIYINKKTPKYIQNTCNDDYNIAIFAGGQLFREYFCFSIEKHIEVLSKANVPIIFNACGLGNIKDAKLFTKLKNALRQDNVISITLREEVETINNLLLEDSNKSAKRTYDPGLCASEVFNIQKENSEVVGLGTIKLGTPFDDEIENIYINLINEFNKKNIKWELFCNGAEGDYFAAVNIAKKLGYDESKVAPRPRTPLELVKTISKYKSLISCRLHSHIIAVSLDIPSVALVWDDKIKHFFDNIECSDRYFDVPISSQEVLTKLMEVENSNYNTKLINDQKVMAKKIMIDNVNRILSK